MHDRAVQALASEGHGGHRIVLLEPVLIVGLIIYARPARRNRRPS